MLVYTLPATQEEKRKKGHLNVKFRPDLNRESPEALSSPTKFYIDPKGLVNEFTDLNEPLLFGTADNERLKQWHMDQKARKARRVARTINKRNRGKR